VAKPWLALEKVLSAHTEKLQKAQNENNNDDNKRENITTLPVNDKGLFRICCQTTKHFPALCS
jgi:hypothetical protein